MGALKFVCNENDVKLETKITSFSSIPLKFLLWLGDNWTGYKEDINRMELFYRK